TFQHNTGFHVPRGVKDWPRMASLVVTKKEHLKGDEFYEFEYAISGSDCPDSAGDSGRRRIPAAGPDGAGGQEARRAALQASGGGEFLSTFPCHPAAESFRTRLPGHRVSPGRRIGDHQGASEDRER